VETPEGHFRLSKELSKLAAKAYAARLESGYPCSKGGRLGAILASVPEGSYRRLSVRDSATHCVVAVGMTLAFGSLEDTFRSLDVDGRRMGALGEAQPYGPVRKGGMKP
jgi:hypothetical protein